jgi:hypothetical protein
MHRTFESSSSKTPHPSSSLHDDGEDDFERRLRLSLVSREEEEFEVNEKGNGARRRAGAQRRISKRDDDDDDDGVSRRRPRVELFSRHQNVASRQMHSRQTPLERDVTDREMHFFFARRRVRI